METAGAKFAAISANRVKRLSVASCLLLLWHLVSFALIEKLDLGSEMFDVSIADQGEIAKGDGVPLLPLSHIKGSLPWHSGMQFPLSIWQFRVSPVARSVV